MGKHTRTMPQCIEEGEGDQEDDAMSLKTFKILKALFKILSTPSHILIVIENLNLCFSLVIIIKINK